MKVEKDGVGGRGTVLRVRKSLALAPGVMTAD
jgi:hypothetical protein